MNRGAGGSGTTMKPTGGNPPSRQSAARTAERAANAAKMQAFFRGLVSEMRRVTWPTRQEWVAATILTVGLVASLSLYMYVIDELLTLVLGLMHR